MPALALALFLALLICQPLQAAPRAELRPFWETSSPSSDRAVDHSGWGEFLKRYLEVGADGINRVAYDAVDASARQRLESYIEALAATDPRKLTRQQQLPYWINLYNALTVKVILDHPDKDSILKIRKQWFSVGPWDDKLLEIAGQAITLNDIEHRILRPIWRDHRIHYAVNCASIGCPNLAAEPYTADNSERLLAAGEIEYINHPRGVDLDDRGRLTLSKIYDWYVDDFAADRPGLLAYLERHHKTLSGRLATHRGRVRFEYDWQLNAAPSP